MCGLSIRIVCIRHQGWIIGSAFLPFIDHPRPKNKLSLRIGRKKDLEKLSIAFVETYENPVVPLAVYCVWICGEALLIIG